MPMTANQIAEARRFLADTGSSETQALTITNATGGTYTLSYGGYTCTPLAYNAVAGVVQNFLAALTSIGIGNVIVTGTNPLTITFQGTLGSQALAIVVANGSALTGVGASAVVTEVLQGGVTAFADAELSDNYDLAGGDNFFLGLVYSCRQLTQDAAKLTKYSLGQTSESPDQIFDHLLKMCEWFEGWAQADRQVQIAGLAVVPPRARAYPWQPSSSAAQEPSRPPWRRSGPYSGGRW